MGSNLVNIEVNGVKLAVPSGQMLIEATDRADIYVPRFCYHHKLSVAANCRMCLVEVEKAPKPLPACATPVAEGMKVFTRSDAAISAQKATMEFLLINHPLDCPICDQGGECELQDLAMGFGRDVARYSEGKRVIKDKDLGPLISTDMTRCIHCTRCVRFGQEIAGIQELGAIGRSEYMEITTYVEQSVDHELSGNIIDLCPVGALNNKPYRYSARAWEMVAKPLISPHDCIGSNVYAHVLRGTLKRVVPRDNEQINESWISDRDRYGYEGIYSQDRLDKPMLKRDEEWLEVSWDRAIEATSSLISSAASGEGDALGILASPNSTLEELYLLNELACHYGCNNLDHRLRVSDFRDQNSDPTWLSLGCEIAEIEQQDGILIVGSNIRMDTPILAHRVRSAALRGASVGFVSPEVYEYHFPQTAYLHASAETFVSMFVGVLAAALDILGGKPPAWIANALKGISIESEHRETAAVLLNKENSILLLGHFALRHPSFADIRAAAAALTELTGSKLGYIPEGANSTGAALAGVLPHRGVGGVKRGDPRGLNVQEMLNSPRRAYLLYGFEPEFDLTNPALANDALSAADTVVCFSPFVTESLLDQADVLLPISTYAETDGTFVNAAGVWQSFNAAVDCVGDAKPGWRLLRALGNAIGVTDCEYQSVEDIRKALEIKLGNRKSSNRYQGKFPVSLAVPEIGEKVLDVPIYLTDGIVRRGTALQQTQMAQAARLDNVDSRMAQRVDD